MLTTYDSPLAVVNRYATY